MLGISQLCLGNYIEAIPQLQRAFDLYDAGRDVDLARRLGADPRVTTPIYLAFAQGPRGNVDDAKLNAEAAVSNALASGHVHSIGYARTFIGFYAAMRGDIARAIHHASALVELCGQYDLPMWSPSGIFLREWAQCKSDENAQIGSGPVAPQHQGVLSPLMCAMHATVIAGCDIEKGLDIFNNTLRQNERGKLNWYDPELHRLKAAVLLRAGRSQVAAAEASIGNALAVSRIQHARTFELCASLDLARLYCDTGREREAVPLLQRALVGFTETPELPEIGEAQRLLDTLS